MNENIEKITNALIKVDEWLTNKGLSENLFEICIFEQVWGSTTCGFSGAGGQTVTSAPTIVVSLFDDRQEVFINGRFAYEVKHPSEMFFRDLSRHWMVGPNDCQRHLYENKKGKNE